MTTFIHSKKVSKVPERFFLLLDFVEMLNSDHGTPRKVSYRKCEDKNNY